MKTLKKVLTLLLAALMLMSLLAGCGKEEEENNDEGGKVKLTIGIPQSASVVDYELNAYTLWLEEQTGYDIEFKLYQGKAADYKAQLSVATLDNEKLPDILMGMDLGSGVFNEYGEDRYFIDLSEYFADKEGKAKIWWDRFETLDKEYQEIVWGNMLNDDGESIYVFPTVEWSDNDVIQYQCLINQDWLKALNLPMPTTREELYNTLVAFRDGDPNGNGKKDEIPLVGTVGDRTFDVVNWIINMYTYNSDTYVWRVDENGKLYTNYASEEYRNALIFINKLVREGLLSSSTWSNTANNLKGLLNPGDGVMTAGIVVGRPTTVMTPGSNAIYSYVAMPYWGNAALGEQRNIYENFITEDCKNPDAAWEVLMLMSTEEGAYRLRYGEKGVDWDWADEGSLTYMGEPAAIKLLNTTAWSTINNSCLHDIVATICINSENESVQVDEGGNAWDQAKLQLMKNIQQNFYAQREKTVDNTIKTLRYTEAQKKQTQAERDNVKAWAKECRAAFCTGEGELNDPSNPDQWAKYVAGLEKNGLSTWQQQVQSIYDSQK